MKKKGLYLRAVQVGELYVNFFLSSSMVNLILRIISHKIKSRISLETERTGILRVHINSTQVVSTKDQVSIILRYVGSDSLVKEDLLALLDAEKSTSMWEHSYLGQPGTIRKKFKQFLY